MTRIPRAVASHSLHLRLGGEKVREKRAERTWEGDRRREEELRRPLGVRRRDDGRAGNTGGKDLAVDGDRVDNGCRVGGGDVRDGGARREGRAGREVARRIEGAIVVEDVVGREAEGAAGVVDREQARGEVYGAVLVDDDAREGEVVDLVASSGEDKVARGEGCEGDALGDRGVAAAALW
eukprot:2704943-Prymnesium_polylepis.1